MEALDRHEILNETYLDHLTLIVLNKINSNPKGFTFNPRDFNSPLIFDTTTDPDLYFVSINGHERIFAFSPSYYELKEWLIKSYEYFCSSGHYIGVWEDNGFYYLDITVGIFGYNNAIAFGKLHKQKAIYHPFSKSEIYLDYDEELIPLHKKFTKGEKL